MALNKSECNYLDITRVIGIFLVVFGHISLIYPYNTINYMVYSFHMPLFVLVSGILHKDTSHSFKTIGNLCYNLLLPLVIYNLLAVIVTIIKTKNLISDPSYWYYFLTGQNFPSMATWFLLALFLG